jgi:Lrp/AsnC family transcriptional regulator for asnA, asnC and gidA
MDTDETDIEILDILQRRGRRPVTSIAEDIGLSTAAVHKRINRLEEAGIIREYRTILDLSALDVNAQAIIRVEFEQQKVDETLEYLKSIDNVQAIRLVAGRWDVVVRMYAEDVSALRAIMFDEIKKMEGISQSEMEVILGTVHRDFDVPL